MDEEAYQVAAWDAVKGTSLTAWWAAEESLLSAPPPPPPPEGAEAEGAASPCQHSVFVYHVQLLTADLRRAAAVREGHALLTRHPDFEGHCATK